MAVTINPVWFQSQAQATGGSREELTARYLEGAGRAATSQSGALEEQRLREVLGGDFSGGRTTTTGIRSTSGGGGGFTPRAPTGSVVTSTPVAPSGPAPTLEAVPDLVVPALDEELMRSETRKAVSAPLRALRRQTREALVRHLDVRNPALRREYTRAAIRGHGEALSQVFGQAQREGRAVAMSERDMQARAAFTRFQAAQQRASQKFQGAMNLYMRRFGTKQTQKSTYGTSGVDAETPQRGGGETFWVPGIGYTTRAALYGG